VYVSGPELARADIMSMRSGAMRTSWKLPARINFHADASLLRCGLENTPKLIRNWQIARAAKVRFFD